MSEKYTIATIKEISEKSKSDRYTVSKVLEKLIKENQINVIIEKYGKSFIFYWGNYFINFRNNRNSITHFTDYTLSSASSRVLCP